LINVICEDGIIGELVLRLYIPDQAFPDGDLLPGGDQNQALFATRTGGGTIEQKQAKDSENTESQPDFSHDLKLPSLAQIILTLIEPFETCMGLRFLKVISASPVLSFKL